MAAKVAFRGLAFTVLGAALAGGPACHRDDTADGSTDAAVTADSGDAGADAGRPGPLRVQVLAFNDFHGALRSTATWTTPTGEVPAGGAAYLATHVARLAADSPASVVVSAGDLFGGSPLLSALFHDEPTVEVMNRMGLALNVVGNHELDEDIGELLRLQHGGCHPQDACPRRAPFSGADFAFVSANMFAASSGARVFPSHVIRRFEGVDVAFVGLSLANTPLSTTPLTDLRFDDEVATVNALVPALQARGIEAIVVVMHAGGSAQGDENGCFGFSGPAADIVDALDPAIDVVITGHTHMAYVCHRGAALVTSAASGGRLLTAIALELDRQSGDVVNAAAVNHVVTQDVTPHPEIEALVARYEARAAPLADRVVGVIRGDLTRDVDASGECSLGNLVADAQLAATSHDAVLAVVHASGLRAPLVVAAAGGEQDGEVTFADAFAVQPFGNVLVTVTLSGQQVHELLEAQWPGTARLSTSGSLRYTWHRLREDGDHVDPGEILVDGTALDLGASYRVTTNSYLTSTTGGRYQVLAQGTEPATGPLDVDALVSYLQANSPIDPPALDRVEVVD